MEIILDGRTVDSRETLHQRLSELLHLPVWYGRNLDALHDCLTELRDPSPSASSTRTRFARRWAGMRPASAMCSTTASGKMKS